MGGNRRFRGMKPPASKGYSRLPTMEGQSTKKAAVGREGLFHTLAVLGLCLCILAIGAFFLIKYSFTINSENYDAPLIMATDGYTSTSFVAEASDVATEVLTRKKPYSSVNFLTHEAQTLTSDELLNITGLLDIDRLFSEELSETSPLLNTRVPGTPGNEGARNYIISQLTSHGIWNIETDDFDDRTPFGMKNFVNIIATLRPKVKRRLVVACHYDSKYFAPRRDGRLFVGATDSAVPCAMMIDLGRNLADLLSTTTQVSTSLQLIFFDGEEAFKQWTLTDSLYGSRHLAAKMQDTPHPKKTSITNQLDAMDMFILLDLIGTPDPVFRNYFPATTAWFGRLANIEAKLKSLGSISARGNSYFDVRLHYSGIGDDHEPFVRRGVNRVIHLIASPFPSVWHTVDDNRDALDKTTIDDLNKILHVFVTEYLHLLDSQPAKAG